MMLPSDKRLLLSLLEQFQNELQDNPKLDFIMGKEVKRIIAILRANIVFNE